jgi:polyribonucleotide nucleotidyltransferase
VSGTSYRTWGIEFSQFQQKIDMGNQIPISTSFNMPNGQEIVLETGKLASLADGSVMVRVGDTMMLCTVVSNKEAKEGQPFFPLSVDYQERYAAGGRIPGNFFRRESKLSDYEVLICRLVDRAIRPLFPDGYMNETQVIINLISGDKETPPDTLAALAASTALTISDIPWAGPISEARVARIDGKFVVNPSKSELERADLNIIIGATLDNVTMVEGEASECQEADMIEAIRFGHEAIRIQCQAQLKLREAMGALAKEKRVFEPKIDDANIVNYVKSEVSSELTEIAEAGLDKTTRKERYTTSYKNFIDKVLAEKGEEFLLEFGAQLETVFLKLKKDTVREMVMAKKIRLDGRKPDEIRHIWSEVEYLPAAHGSALFTRGETQALATVTLGSKLDSMLIDNALENYYEKFFLHYNFPPYSTGEVKPQRGPGRREVGHANLAARSIRRVLPENPYIIRIVADILESNGSSSMATVCSGSMALMDAGIQIKEHVAGIAMGLISDGTRHVVLSDILGDEDALGDMDFKITGTSKGITGCQMDIKVDGMPYEILTQALEQARQGRLHILSKMNEVISKPNTEVKPHAPRIVELIIDKSFIGAVIGPGGKIIQEMQAETETVINIEEVDNKGIVSIASNNKANIERAVARIKSIAFMPQVGDVFDAKVASVQAYGVFVDFNGKSGLLHVSEISNKRIDNVEDVLKVGDEIRVKLIGIDPKTGKFRLSSKVLQTEN